LEKKKKKKKNPKPKPTTKAKTKSYKNQTKQGENPNDTQFAAVSVMLVAAWCLVFLSTEAGKKGWGERGGNDNWFFSPLCSAPLC
jgi:hypothetical protein